jgi:hypothetical protein
MTFGITTCPRSPVLVVIYSMIIILGATFQAFHAY